MGKVKRSIHADTKDLTVSCEIDDCVRRFLNLMGMRTHLAKVHGVSHKGRKTVDGETYCKSCSKNFASNKAYLSHGPIVCFDRRLELWGVFVCQNSKCEKEFEKYVGSNRDRKGQKYCSNECSQRARRAEAAKVWIAKDPLVIGYEIHDEFTKYSKKCRTCGNIFYTNSVVKKSCSKECIRHEMSDTSNMGGLRDGGGRSKSLTFVSKNGDQMSLNIEEIRVAKFFDLMNFKWRRNFDGFTYIDLDGRKRKFHPDFYIHDLDLYVEYKGWTTPEMLHKMKDAVQRNEKLNLLIVVGDSQRFADHGICISDLENDPTLLVQTFS